MDFCMGRSVHEIEPYIHQKEEEGVHIFSILFEPRNKNRSDVSS